MQLYTYTNADWYTSGYAAAVPSAAGLYGSWYYPSSYSYTTVAAPTTWVAPATTVVTTPAALAVPYAPVVNSSRVVTTSQPRSGLFRRSRPAQRVETYSSWPSYGGWSNPYYYW